MPKIKLKLDAEQFKALPLAASLADIKIGEAEKVGKKIHVLVSHRTPMELLELGEFMGKVTKEEIEAHSLKVKAASEKKAIAEKK